ncbi:glycosyltransferase [Acinetobacter gerneri]|uniref:Glycosyltransferase n=1 Tax=Acinetobacter gerneri TaxID=202952 RepID=A0AAW8JLE4_9GAMM|nr:glycosyltransferase [Acinetobacter gerneri]MDQ9010698.1 glycosyltransferase [Acinetobacter gerneri]MDQ9014870.1 glycosyltransferase [Acinetobacter gerneri]MDQ9026068.1 glycosyltransferase [Acinetobacter gerneri]MDQ9053322.1 glycosyltransferase [Acinetobacter gerneri]MDQ9060941.1 glycosyltransferase [Acinetobacter gerneri]
MKNLIILTESFPFDGGEQFIESEVEYWAKINFDKVYIVPNSHPTISIRNYPSSIKVLEKPPVNKLFKFIFILFVWCFDLFWKDFFYLIRSKKLNFNNIMVLVKAIVVTKLRVIGLKDVLKEIKGDVLIYSYWNDVDFYAACELKKRGSVNKVISRSHGYDCYEERRKGYMPLKRQYKNLVDRVFLLSDSAKKYFKAQYNYDLEKLGIARLGVDIPQQKIVDIAQNNKIEVLSISNCIAIKRVDKIIEVLNKYSLIYKVQVEWTHIGSGELFESLKQKSLLYMKNNHYFKAQFLGSMRNSDVKQNLAQHTYSFFINASESEGVPVSIMEAMSYGVPVIAPDIGGISDIVTSETGYLLNSNPCIDDYVIAIHKVLSDSKYVKYRENAFKLVKDKYNRNKNYESFINALSKISNE